MCLAWTQGKQNVLCRLEGGKADKRILNLLPSRRLCMDGNFKRIFCYLI